MHIKTKYMIVKSIRKELRGNTILKCLDGIEIERVETMKYLGIINFNLEKQRVRRKVHFTRE